MHGTFFSKFDEYFGHILSSYRQIPTFGKDTIRRFTANASAMRKLGARDFEDLLQVCLSFLCSVIWLLIGFECAIPVFEGLLPKKHDKIMQKLLFELATWHGLAKLRLHTETTVNDLEHSTTRLGTALRDFEANVCSVYTTTELPSEEAAKKANTHLPKKPIKAGKLAPQSKRTRKFNLSTYKLHALGHYPRAIRLFGTSDNFN